MDSALTSSSTGEAGPVELRNLVDRGLGKCVLLSAPEVGYRFVAEFRFVADDEVLPQTRTDERILRWLSDAHTFIPKMRHSDLVPPGVTCLGGATSFFFEGRLFLNGWSSVHLELRRRDLEAIRDHFQVPLVLGDRIR